jgi:hypothetical protein
MLLNGAPVKPSQFAIRNNYHFASFPAPFATSNNRTVMRPMRSRKPIIENPKDLAADFACAVTEASSNQSDWVARNGEESLFSTLQRIIPEVWGMFS